ncbi:MAG: hypothetical protein ACLUR9_00160 [Christensenellales bacterium]
MGLIETDEKERVGTEKAQKRARREPGESMAGASIEKTAFWISGTFNSAKAGVEKAEKSIAE